MKQRDPRQHDRKHLDFIRSLPCCVCLNSVETEAAHVRMSDAMSAKINPGVGAKPHDRWTVPLCSQHHREQHADGDERAFWHWHCINPLWLALVLHSVTGNHYAARRAIEAHHINANDPFWRR